MIDYRRVAIRVLAKVKGYDPRLPTDELQVDAWAEHLARHRLGDLNELLAAVTEYFDNPHNRPTQPADITGIVREYHDRLAGITDPPRYVPLPPGVGTDGVTPVASAEHRRKCMAEITATLGKRWSVDA